MNIYHDAAPWPGMTLRFSLCRIRSGVAVALLEILGGAIFRDAPAAENKSFRAACSTLLAT